MGYPDNIKAGRMTVVRDAANGGRLELLAADSTILASLALDTPSGAVAGPVLTYAGFPKSTTALVASTVGAPGNRQPRPMIAIGSAAIPREAAGVRAGRACIPAR